jgi:Icc-related predicted phosphoesterase
VIRRVSVHWPDDRPFRAREGRSIRLLAASDMREPAMEVEANRLAIAPVDAVIGCGDLDPHWLAFLADAFEAPLVYVRGNHDHGGDWDEHDSVVPEPLGSGAVTRLAGIVIGGLEWPAGDRGNRRRPDLAWWQALRLALRRARSGVGRWSEPMVVISHAAPEGAGDVPSELYHRGFGAYRWLLDRFRPPLWLHGHTTTASVTELQVAAGSTTVINVTGAVLIELLPPLGA